MFLDGIVALHAMDVFLEFSVRIPVRPIDPQEVRDAFSSEWLGICGHPKGTQTVEGCRWGTKSGRISVQSAA